MMISSVWRPKIHLGVKILMLGVMASLSVWVQQQFSASGFIDVPMMNETDWYTIEAPVFTEMRVDQPLRSFSARKFVINRRSFLGFQTRFAQQAEFHDASLRLYRNQQDGKGSLIGDVGDMLQFTMSSAKRENPSVKSSLRITRLIMAPFTLETIVDTVPSVRLQAESALVDNDPGEIQFKSAMLEDLVQHRKIFSKEILWKDVEQVFEIKGEYYAESPKGRAVAKGLRVGLDFTLTPF
ncbi:MAG: hypothetical protein HQL93_02810 [Magnetococcales bacterium]|nr:hypothetical protein [Magnetococcales bacterium]